MYESIVVEQDILTAYSNEIVLYPSAFALETLKTKSFTIDGRAVIVLDDIEKFARPVAYSIKGYSNRGTGIIRLVNWPLITQKIKLHGIPAVLASKQPLGVWKLEVFTASSNSSSGEEGEVYLTPDAKTEYFGNFSIDSSYSNVSIKTT